MNQIIRQWIDRAQKGEEEAVLLILRLCEAFSVNNCQV